SQPFHTSTVNWSSFKQECTTVVLEERKRNVRDSLDLLARPLGQGGRQAHLLPVADEGHLDGLSDPGVRIQKEGQLLGAGDRLAVDGGDDIAAHRQQAI